jgi:uncharacterized protein involved in exopolysaccharide biosynthesis
VITQNYARLSKEAAANNQNYQDYLLALLEGEVLQRDENAQKLRLVNITAENRQCDRERPTP